MRSSRGLLQKRERDAKLKNIMSSSSSSSSSSSRQEQPRDSDRTDRKIKPVERVSKTSSSVSASVPSSSYSSVSNVSKPSKNSQRNRHQEDEQYDEEYSQRKPPSKVSTVTVTNEDEDEDFDIENDEIMYESEEEEEEQVISTRKAPKQQQVQSPKIQKVESREVTKDEYEEEEVEESKSKDTKKRSSAIVSKNILSKMVHEAGLEGVSADVYPFIIQEMQNYIREVIETISEGSNEEELVIRDTDLKFLGDKTRAAGNLDMKSFERLYAGVAESMGNNAEFSSGAFRSFCSFTEIAVHRFLRKAKDMISFYNRKRLTAKDLECLRRMMDDNDD